MILHDSAGNEYLCAFDHEWLRYDIKAILEVCRINEPLQPWMNRKNALQAGLPVVEWEAQAANDDEWISELIAAECAHNTDLEIDYMKESR